MDTLKVSEFQGSGQSKQIMEPIPDPNVGQEIGLKKCMNLKLIYVTIYKYSFNNLYVCV